MIIKNKINNYSKLIDVFYLIAKLNGITPFEFNKAKFKVNSSISLTIYCCIFLIIFTILSLCACILISNNDVKNTEFVIRLINYSEISFTFIKTIILYIIQIKNRKDIINVINFGIQLEKLLKFIKISATLSPSPPSPHQFKIEKAENFYDNKFYYYIKLKGLLICFQVLSIISLIFALHITYESIYNTMIYVISWLFLFYSYFPCMIIGTFYYIGMLIAIQYFRILNDRLKIIMIKINEIDNNCETIYSDNNSQLKLNDKMQRTCNFSDDIDQISILYSKICDFVQSINKVFSTHIFVTLIVSFVIIIGEVTFRRINKTILSQYIYKQFSYNK